MHSKNFDCDKIHQYKHLPCHVGQCEMSYKVKSLRLIQIFGVKLDIGHQCYDQLTAVKTWYQPIIVI